jgi:hypothetical protein
VEGWLVRAKAGKLGWGGTMKRGRAVVVVLYAHTNWCCKCRALQCQGGVVVGMQTVTASVRLAQRERERKWQCMDRLGVPMPTRRGESVRESHELGCRAAAAAAQIANRLSHVDEFNYY